MRLSLLFRSGRILAALFPLFLASCATHSKPSKWIKVGSTTRDEVVEQYGEPDLIRSSADGEIETYRLRLELQPRLPIYVPVAEAGGENATIRTRDQPIEHGLGARGVGAGSQARPEKEFEVRYDVNGVVRSLIE